MRDVDPHPRLASIARRTIIVGAHDGLEYARQLADAAAEDARMGGRGVVVSMRLTDDPADAPADCVDCVDIFNGGPLL